MVNVNACTTTFYQPQNLAMAMIQFEQSSFGARASTFVRRVRVKTTHLGYKKTVKNLAGVNARQHKFDSGEFGTITVEQYFKKSILIYFKAIRDTNDPLQNTISPFPTLNYRSWMSEATNRTSFLLKFARYFRINRIVTNLPTNTPQK